MIIDKMQRQIIYNNGKTDEMFSFEDIVVIKEFSMSGGRIHFPSYYRIIRRGEMETIVVTSLMVGNLPSKLKKVKYKKADGSIFEMPFL